MTNDPSPRVDKAVKETAKSVEHQSRKVADSAQDVKQSSRRIETSAELTTRLAADRNVLAAERTYAAWVRTGLFAFASGLGARALLTGILPEWLILANATALIAFSIFCFGAAIFRYFDAGPPPPAPDVRPIPRTVLVAVSVFLAVISLAALIGIWLPGSDPAPARMAPSPVIWPQPAQSPAGRSVHVVPAGSFHAP